MSFRKPFQRVVSFRDAAPRGLVRRKARGLIHNVLPACVETLEERALLSAVIPGFDDHGLSITNAQASGQASISVTSADNAQLSGNARGSGLFIDLDNSSGSLNNLRRISLTGVTVQNNGNAGVQIRLANMSLDSLVIDRALVRANGGSGLYITLENVQIGTLTIIDSANRPNADDLNSGASRFSNNEFDGIHFIARTTDTANATRITNFTMSGGVMNANVGHGAFFNLDRTTITNFTLNDNEARANTNGSGIHFKTNRTNIGLGNGRVLNNTFGGNSSHGLSFLTESLNANSVPTGESRVIINQFNNNLSANNGGAGISFDLRAQTRLNALMLNNVINGNQLHGFDVRAADAEGAFGLQFGTLTRNPVGNFIHSNTFNGNVGAAIALDLSDISGNLGNTTGFFRAYGNRILNTAAQAGSLVYRGDGINVRVRGDVSRPNGAALLTNSIIDQNLISGNAGDGIRFSVSEDSELTNLRIGNRTGVNQTFDVNGASAGGGSVVTQAGNGNDILDNGRNGISIIRVSSAYVRDIQIVDNNIQGNAEGIYVQASNTYQTVPTAARPNLNVVTEVTIDHNNIRVNRGSGVHFRTEFDAVMVTYMRYNRIDGNGQDGIRSTAVENNFADFENLGGTWIKNAITNNGENGIRLEAVTGMVNPLIIGQDGMDVFDNQSLGNFIGLNGEDGIEISNQAGAGGTVVPTDFRRNDVTIINNQIIGNGQDELAAGTPNPYLAGKGIDIELRGHTRRFRIDRNVIEGNGGDGLEIRNAAGELGMTASGNTIQGNGGRGVDVLVQASGGISAIAHIVFGNTNRIGAPDPADSNLILNNGLEGFYVVTTASTSQTQDVNAEDLLLADGSRDATIDFILNIDNNEIRDNGLGIAETGSQASTFSGTGLVLRVGANTTAEGPSTDPDLTGNINPFSEEAQAGVGRNLAGIGNGRTNARITYNDFSGNGGDDVLIETFASTPPPPTTTGVGGTWNQDSLFGPSGSYERDPLARVNIVFVGNTGESLDVVRGPGSTDGNSAGVLYTNGEGDYKSRTPKAAPNVSGPFNSGSRPRIGTRVADRPSSLGGLSLAYSEIFGFSGNLAGPFDGAPFTGGNVPDLSAGVVNATAEATTIDVSLPGPIRVSATIQAGDPLPFEGQVLLVSIQGTGSNADGTHAAYIVNVDNVTGTVLFDLFVPVDVGNYTFGNQYAGGGTIVPFDFATASSGSFVFHNPNKFYYDGIGPSTLRIETGWELTNDFNPNNGTSGGFDDFQGVDFSLNRGVPLSHGTIGWDEVVAGTFGFLTASISDTVVDEASGNATLTITLSEPAPEGGVRIFYETSDGEALYDPNNDGDFTDRDYNESFGSVLFAEGQMTATITVGVLDDDVFESPERFYIDLTSMQSDDFDTYFSIGEIVDRRGIVEITEAAQVKVGDGQIVEGDNGARNMAFTITLEGGGGTPITVGYSTANGTATAGDDFEARSGNITFQPGETTKTILVPIIGDLVPEANEVFTVVLSSPTGGAEIGNNDGSDTGLGSITDNDTPAISINDVVVTESNANQVVTFTVRLSKAVDGVVKVNYRTANGSAAAGQDYRAKVGTLTFAAGETSKVVHIMVLGDQTLEDAETFVVNLSGPTNGTLGKATGLATINDEDTPSVTINNVVVTEGDGGGNRATFTVRLSKAANTTVRVHYETSNGSAVAGEDFQAISGNLVFAAGETVKRVSVPIIGDRAIEPNEQFTLVLSAAVNANITDNSGTATLRDDDIPSVTIEDIGVLEDEQIAVFRVTLSNAVTGSIVAMDYRTRNGTAVGDGIDFNSATGQIVFQPGQRVQTIFVRINPFDAKEPNEYFFVDLSNPTNATFRDATGRGLIIDPGTAVGLVTGPRTGHSPLVRVYEARADQIRYSFFAYETTYRGGVEIAVGDVNRDGVVDIITAPGSNGLGPDIRVWDGASGALMKRFFAFGQGPRDMLSSTFDVAAGDVNGDGAADIIVSITSGTPAVRVFDGLSGRLLEGFFAFPRNYQGGVRIAAGDVTGDGRAEVIAIPASPGVGSIVRVFNGLTGARIKQFYAYNSSLTSATYDLAAGDVTGDGVSDIVVSIASGAGPAVRVFSGGDYRIVSAFFAYPQNFRGGVNVGVGDVNFDGRGDVITAPHSGSQSYVRFFDGVTKSLLAVPPQPYARGYHGGVNVAGQTYEGDQLRLDGQMIANSNAAGLQLGQAQAMLAVAAERFRAAGFSEAVVDQLATTEISIADLAGDQLGVARPGTIVLDVNAAGLGWFIDQTPLQNEEYARAANGAYRAVSAAALGKLDLLSVLAHELAHQLGFDDVDSALSGDSLMTATLTPGTRRATREHLDDLFEDADLMDALLTA